MSGSPIPLWVTITLAVLAFVGTLGGAWGGQWIATRRDDRRWEREAKREDLRWKREQERLSDQRQHELQLNWAEKRLAAYAECYRLAQLWLQRLTAGAPSNIWDRLVYTPRFVNPAVESLDKESLDEASSSFREHLVTIRIVGSKEAYSQAVEVYVVLGGLKSIAAVAEAMTSSTLTEGSIDNIVALIEKLGDTLQKELTRGVSNYAASSLNERMAEPSTSHE